MFGLTLAPATAEVLASLVRHGTSTADLAPFDVGRFGGPAAAV